MLFKNCSIAVMNSLKNNPVFIYADLPYRFITSVNIERIYAVYGDYILFDNSDYLIPGSAAYKMAKIYNIDLYGMLHVTGVVEECLNPKVGCTLMELANVVTVDQNQNHLATSYYALDDELINAVKPSIPDTYNNRDKMQIVIRHPLPIQDVNPNMINASQLKEENDMAVNDNWKKVTVRSN